MPLAVCGPFLTCVSVPFCSFGELAPGSLQGNHIDTVGMVTAVRGQAGRSLHGCDGASCNGTEAERRSGKHTHTQLHAAEEPYTHVFNTQKELNAFRSDASCSYLSNWENFFHLQLVCKSIIKQDVIAPVLNKKK